METIKENFTSKGANFLGSYAQRHFYYKVDKNLAKQYNENGKKDKSLVSKAIIIGVLSVTFGIWLYTLTGFWVTFFGIICCLIGTLSLIIGIVYYKRVVSPTALLKRGILNAGIIAQIDDNGVGLLVLAETTGNNENEGAKYWALCSYRLYELPPVHEKKIGELIPVTCIYSDSNENYNTSVIASPIAWGTNSKEVIQKAIEGINPIEWNALIKSRSNYDFKIEYSDVEKTKQLTTEEIVELNLHFIADFNKSIEECIVKLHNILKILGEQEDTSFIESLLGDLSELIEKNRTDSLDSISKVNDGAYKEIYHYIYYNLIDVVKLLYKIIDEMKKPIVDSEAIISMLVIVDTSYTDIINNYEKFVSS